MKTIVFVLVCCCVLTTFSAAGQVIGHFVPRDRLQMAVGTIQAVERNTIEILDEKDGFLKRLVYLGIRELFYPGDRVRVYYDPGDDVISVIKKMTALEYVSDKQNLGYILNTSKTGLSTPGNH